MYVLFAQSGEYMIIDWYSIVAQKRLDVMRDKMNLVWVVKDPMKRAWMNFPGRGQ